MGLADLVGIGAEEKLQTIFAAASHWGAILLLDEADVVLEQRSFENLARNAYVSSKQGRFMPRYLLYMG
jgi:hypothetical protein